MLEIKGRIYDGLHQAAEFTQLDWLKGDCHKILGFIPYPGTLNIKVIDRNYELWRTLQTLIKGVEIKPPNDEFCSALVYLGMVENLSVGAIVPSVEGYPDNVIELLASVRLRDQLNIRNGDLVKVKFFYK